jgi:hypothetical protein
MSILDATLTQPLTQKIPTKVGYWASHDYHRLNVKDYVEEFCGWKAIQQLTDYVYGERDKAFVVFLYMTGGRVTEVLNLHRSHFEIKESVWDTPLHEAEKAKILVRNMMLLKRYKKLGERIRADGKKGWTTQKIFAKRQTFPIMMNEPLVPIMIDWLHKHECTQENPNPLLFTSPRRVAKDGSALPLTKGWAYKLIRHTDKMLPKDLKMPLGLDVPEMHNNVEINKCIHLWLHWFRSQRASQLVSDYGFSVMELIGWFSWESYDTALRYSKRGWRGLADKMDASKPTYS